MIIYLKKEKEEQEKLSQTQHQNANQKIEELLEQQKVLRKELEERPTIDQIQYLKNQVAVLQSIESFDENDLLLLNFNEKEKSSFQLLELKNKKLQSNLTQLSISQQELTQKIQDLTSLNQSLNESLIKKVELINQLEEDLLSFKNNPSNFSSSLFVSSKNQTSSSSQSNSTDPSSSSSQDVLTILSSQRDRFKERAFQLEKKIEILQNELKNKSNLLQMTKDDNYKLYEKIRYLQSYSPKHLKLDIENLEKYKQVYDDPFSSFKKREKKQKYDNMSTAEKVIYNTSSLFLANKYTRLFILFYNLLLHSLVFYVLSRY